MARSGVSKEEVRIARQSILARGEHPSIDALRVELGNTGSKSTIHRLLKELDAEQTGHSPSSLSEELGELVGQLANRLQQEARAALAEERGELSRQRQDQQQELRLARQRIDELQAQNQALAEETRETREQARQLQQQKHQVELTNARLRQAAGDLEARLRDRDAQITALEERLDQLRLAAAEQREQDLRQHEEVSGQLRGELRRHQDELTRLNRDNERLLTEARLLRER
ncbi:hypothetical protein PKB_2760 [Pseudomonas knackmussii B13]|uniref:KfrA N-terminal DNA-binding domain-containing protein n=1 Tax=Pseudomonas knackmussii (strain DSM 6978 / CCUG 54928 / LMG 23759 / B13) TaxID=1301098 RepID=A0A024HI01_PSEKB|nr:DNA-binding protein [Pseudomonas knackmussii]CDF84107.1 hypothetical protein PKB_2760 [Pseudomonas knackmussii B13]